MNNTIYADISERTGGDIYIGVVGPVRTGKSTFIKKMMDTLVIPHIDGEFKKERARDELPQSAAGRTIMTTEPKFIPEDSIEITLPENVRMKVRMIDCVGYIVPSSEGYIEESQPRMVMTPWYEEEIPFNMAAEIGTRKVIEEHSTIGLVVTTDGSISTIPREEYAEAEERVINELKAINKPFVVVMNCTNPETAEAQELCRQLTAEYGVPVLPLNCMTLTEEQIQQLLTQVLYAFPVSHIGIQLPSWFHALDDSDAFRSSLIAAVRENASAVHSIRAVADFTNAFADSDTIEDVRITDTDLSSGAVTVRMDIDNSYFYQIMSEKSGVEITDDAALLKEITTLSAMRQQYERFEKAMEAVESTGYGIVMPTIDELSLEEPEMMKQGGKYGVRLKAHAPSVHMIKCNTYTEVAPIVGSESQSEELVRYLLKEFESNPSEIWETNLFGKSLHELVNEGLINKLYRMPEDARNKFRETIERVINEGCSGLICILI